MRRWLRHGYDAGRIVGDRADLWVAASLAWLAYAGLILFLGAVVPFPTTADLAFFTKDIAIAESPLPALMLGAALLAGFVALLLLHAAGESVLIGELDGRRGFRGWLAGTASLMGVMLVASVPVAAAGLLLSWRLAVVAPAEYQSPDIGGSLAVRIVGGVLPQLVLVLVALVVAQVLAAGASWRVAGRRRSGLVAALRDGARDAVRAPLRLLGVALVTLAAHLAYAAIVVLLLRLLFAPIAAALSAGEVRDVAVTALLIGFVAIWLCLVLGGGALHAWASAWWAGELDAMRPAAPPVAPPSVRADVAADGQQHEGASL